MSNRGPDPDRFFNYDVFAAKVTDGTIRRLTDTKSAEYRPEWSPDGAWIAFQGTTRDLTSSETTMEDTHVWVMDGDGANRREVGPDRQPPGGARVVALTAARSTSPCRSAAVVAFYRQPLTGGEPAVVTPGEGSVGAWSPLRDGRIVYAFADRTGGRRSCVISDAAEKSVTPS